MGSSQRPPQAALKKAIQNAHQQLVADFGADRAHALRTELGYNDRMLEPMAEKKDSTAA